MHMTLTPITTLTPLTTEKQKPPHGGGLVGLSLFNCALTPALLFSLKLLSFRCDVPQEQSVAYNISSPHSFRLFQQSVGPFQSMLLPPHRCTCHCACKEVKHCAYRSYVAVYVKLVPVRVSPFLLLRCRHAYPQQVGVSLVYSLYYGVVVFFAELRLIWWRIRLHCYVWIVHGSPFLYQAQHLFAAAHKEALTALAVQLVHLKHKQIPSGYALFGLRLSLQPFACLHYAHSVRNKHIAFCQGLCKQLVLQGGVIRVSVNCVYQQFALRQFAKCISALLYRERL